ncbi:MmcQ/YjbR family DNA-binding protein [Actinocatenispora rupis]|uniref:YjbR protein n=1 Tax=Actinocatenispora rupis TaxID=519421 RepID=A0A8J3JCM4_9ACTN|nr:MmcQ/YjbR family DNA-binding protein [Actinocatenispora rupis]GID14289.1 hypothetical protein Aru02nite_51780 [Actinocatenispora rupis]
MRPATVRGRIRAFALDLPEAYEDLPWGEVVAKVNRKVFVFLGVDEPDDDRYGFTVKLAESHDQALSLPCTRPTGYGLGRAGWVTVSIGPDTPPVAVCTDWVTESYRLVAPKRLSRLLD